MTNPISSGPAAKRPRLDSQPASPESIAATPALAEVQTADAALVHAQIHQTNSSLRDSTANSRASNVQPLTPTPVETLKQSEHLTPLPEELENRIIFRLLDTAGILALPQINKIFQQKHTVVTQAVVLFRESIALAKEITQASQHEASSGYSRDRALLKTAEVLSEIARKLAQAGFPDKAKNILKLAKEKTQLINRDDSKQSASIAIASAEAETGDVESAKATANTIECDYAKANVLQIVACVLVNTGNFDGAKQIAGMIGDDYLKTLALDRIVGGEIEVGDFQAAKETSATINAVKGKVEALVKIAEALTKSELSDQAQDILVLAEETARATAYETENTNEAKKVEVLAETAVAFAKAKFPEQAYRILGLAKVKAAVLVSLGQDINGIARKKIVIAEAELGHFAAAKQTANTLADPVKASALCYIAIAQAKVGDIEAAKETASAINEDEDEDGADEDSDAKTRALVGIVDAQCLAGNFAAARETADTIHPDMIRVRNDVFCSTAIAQAKAEDFDGACQTLVAILRCGYGDEYTDKVNDVLCGIAIAQTKGGDVEGAKATVSDIIGVAEESLTPVEVAFLKATALVEIAVELLKTGMLDQAKQILALAEPETAGHSYQTFRSGIAIAFAKAGDVEGAKRTANMITGYEGQDRVDAFASVAFTLAEGAAVLLKDFR